MRNAAIRFIRNKLEVPETEVNDDQIVRVRRMQPPRRSMVHLEVCVVFGDKYSRDVIAAHGKNLKDYVNDRGQPTLGMRIQYPDHLGEDFRLLEWYGAELRKMKGPGTRRSIRFNDEDGTIYTDVQLPNTDRWHRVTTEMAREAKAKKKWTQSRESTKAINLYQENGVSTNDLLYSRPPTLTPVVQLPSDDPNALQMMDTGQPSNVGVAGSSKCNYVSPKKNVR